MLRKTLVGFDMTNSTKDESVFSEEERNFWDNIIGNMVAAVKPQMTLSDNLIDMKAYVDDMNAANTNGDNTLSVKELEHYLTRLANRQTPAALYNKAIITQSCNTQTDDYIKEIIGQEASKSYALNNQVLKGLANIEASSDQIKSLARPVLEPTISRMKEILSVQFKGQMPDEAINEIAEMLKDKIEPVMANSLAVRAEIIKKHGDQFDVESLPTEIETVPFNNMCKAVTGSEPGQNL